ncbi:hypothetical protein M798_16245 [Brucella melitensis ADMAS-G1]|nr:hypothetical protein M798_16245 [Brucella melitensis ADMAS-G1]
MRDFNDFLAIEKIVLRIAFLQDAQQVRAQDAARLMALAPEIGLVDGKQQFPLCCPIFAPLRRISKRINLFFQAKTFQCLNGIAR